MTTTRRSLMSALLGLGAGQALLGNTLDQNAWLAYEAVEEAWIRDRHALLVVQFPECGQAAEMDLELKLAELQRRGLQFQYLSKSNPQQLRGGMWQLSWLPLTEVDLAKLLAGNAPYKKIEEKIRHLSEDLRNHPHYEDFHKAQAKLWKTSEYRVVHRRYTGRLQDLNRIYSGVAAAGI